MASAIIVTKIEAARRQLRSAIELWFLDGDPVSIHTLAAAAHQIIHDLNRRNKGPDMLLDTKFIKDEYRSEFVSDIKSASNFMKHADRGKMGTTKTFEFDPESNDNFIMWAIFGLGYLGENLGPEEIAFERWQLFQNPDLISDAGKELFDKTYTIKKIETIRAIPKHKFLETIRLLIGQAHVS